MEIRNIIKSKTTLGRNFILFGMLGLILPSFAFGEMQSTLSTAEAPEKSEASDVVYYLVRLKGVELSNNPEMITWGDSDTPDLYAIVDYNNLSLKTDHKDSRYCVDFDKKWKNAETGEFVIPNQNLSRQSFYVTCVDYDSCGIDDTIFTIAVYGGMLKNAHKDGILNIFVDKDGKILDKKDIRGDPYHTLTFIVEERKGAKDKEENKKRQWEIGQWFQHTCQDREKAKTWYEKAAADGHSCAQFDLGWYCYYDKGDYKNAVTWFEKAAQQNNPNACYLLGDCYSMGRGVPKDISAAIRWYEKAESLGNKDAATRIRKLNESK